VVGGREEGGTVPAGEEAAGEPLAAGELGAVSWVAVAMCRPGWGRADAVVTLHGGESALDEEKVLVEERVVALESVVLSLEQFRSEAGRRWLAAAGSLGEGGRGTDQRLGCLASVGGLRRGFLASW